MEERINELKELLTEIWDIWDEFDGARFQINEKSWLSIEQDYDDNGEGALVIEEYEEVDSEQKRLGGCFVPGSCLESDDMLNRICNDILIKKILRQS